VGEAVVAVDNEEQTIFDGVAVGLCVGRWPVVSEMPEHCFGCR